MNNQKAKADAGKHRLSLVPSEIIRNIARIRELIAERKLKQEIEKTKGRGEGQ